MHKTVQTAAGRWPRLTVAALVAALGFVPQPERAPWAQEAPGTETTAPVEGEPEARRIQDWMVRCGRPNGEGPEMCEMLQQRVGENRQPMLVVAVGKVPGRSEPGMIIVLPLGISLPPGVALKVDDGAEMPLEVERCEREGCRIELLLQPALLAQLKAGREARVLFHVPQPGQLQRVAVPISLLGFTGALNEVMASG